MLPKINCRMTAQDLVRLQLISGCEISPDGTNVAFGLQRVNPVTGNRLSNLWLVPTEGGAARQFTFGDQVDSEPHWSPDGSHIAFLSNRGDGKQAQIYVIPLGGGEGQPVTDLRGDFGRFEWSPDGRQLAFAFRKKDQDELDREQDERRRELGIVSRHVTRVRYKLDGYGYLPKERWHIWTIDIQSGSAQQLTDGDIFDEQDPLWSPDSEWLVFLSNRSDDPDFYPDCMDLFAIPPAGGGLRTIDAPVGRKFLPSFSPDGCWLAYVGSKGQGEHWRHDRLWVVPFDGRGPAQDLTGECDISVSSSTINDLGGATMVPPVWAPDGKTLYFQVSRHGNTELWSASLAHDCVQPVINSTGVVGAFSLESAGASIAYLWADVQDPGQIWVYNLTSDNSERLTSFNLDWLQSLDIGTIEEVWFRGAKDNDLQGWILKPPGFDPSLTYPAILEIHGGPLLQYGNLFMHEFYYLAAQGYIVFFCNPRGGRGYGEQHARAMWNNVDTVDYDDLMAWADHVIGRPYVDGGRLGVTGGSYGGFLTNWTIGHTDRFKAAVSQRCVTNRISSYGTADMNWTHEIKFEGEAPWENVENYWQQSPIKYISHAKTPTLIIHSEQDMRCPLEQGEQLFVALKRQGVDTEMVIFPEESHGLSRIGRADRRIARLEHILRWFDRHLKAGDG